MIFVKEALIKREQMLKELIKKKQQALKKVPEGSLRANKHGRGIQFFHFISADNPSGVYIKKSNIKLAKELAQKEYDQKVLKRAEKEYAILRKLNVLYRNGTVEETYENIAFLKQHLIVPIRMSDKEYVENWQNEPYIGLGFREDGPEFYSNKGERVRSKSELMIANALNKYGIPYKYECPLELKSYGTVYPDFTVLNVKERKEMYWEHLGLLDDYDYRERNLNKLTWYELNNLFLGDRLILTFETAKHPLSTKLINMIINKYLL